MKALIIIRDINDNFKHSSPEIKIANSIVHFQTANLEEGVRTFNKLKVASEMFIIDMTILKKPIYYKTATKEILTQQNSIRILRTIIINQSVLIDINEKVIEGDQDVNIFFENN